MTTERISKIHELLNELQLSPGVFLVGLCFFIQLHFPVGIYLAALQ